MPAAAIASRMRSAAAQSLAARASARCVIRVCTSASSADASAPAGAGLPHRVERVDAEDAGHDRRRRRTRARAPSRSPVVERGVARAHASRGAPRAPAARRGRRPSPRRSASGTVASMRRSSESSCSARTARSRKRADALERRLGLVEGGRRDVEARAVVRGGERVADDERVALAQHVLGEQEVAERLRHLLVADGDEAVVHPVARERRRRRRSTAPARSRGAGSAGRARRRGCRTRDRGSAATSRSTRCASRAGRRPHGDSQVALSGSSGFAPFHRAKSRGSRLPRGSASSRRLHRVERLARERAVVAPGAHVEVHVAVRRRRRARVDEARDELLHLRDGCRRARLVGRRRGCRSRHTRARTRAPSGRRAPTTARRPSRSRAPCRRCR